MQRLRRLIADAAARHDEQLFVVEGPRAVEEALDAGVALDTVYAAPDAPAALLTRAADAGAAIARLAPGVLERAASTVTPQPIAALARRPRTDLASLAGATFLVVAVGVADPGNLGTLLRSARAAGADGVVSCGGSVDVFNPKAVRAAAGSLFHSRVVSGDDPVEVLHQLGRWGLCRLGASAHGGTPYDAVDLRRPVALVLGNEARGLPGAVGEHLDATVTIPMAPGAESLNVGVAAALLCFEARRQRGWESAGAAPEVRR